MSRSNTRTSVLFILIATRIAFAASPARGAWPPSGLPVATGAAQPRSPIGLTGPGGELHMFWTEFAATTHGLYAQHLTLAGTPAPGWPAGGRGVVAAPAAIGSPLVIPDGAGGAILGWNDFRSTDGLRGVYAIRLDADANVLPGWTSSGTLICVSPGPQGPGPIGQLMALCGDGEGGAFIAWTDNRNTVGTMIYDVFAHHVLADSTLDPGWPATGRALTTGEGYKYPHELIADGTGGFWLATENSNATEKIAVTHHGSDGNETGRWTTPSFASRVAGVSDGGDGIFVTWRDCRDCLTGTPTVGIYAIRLIGHATPRFGWPAGGVAIVTSTVGVDLPVIVATDDGAAMIAWLAPEGAYDAYAARRVESNGTFAPAWQAGPREFAVSDDILSGWPLHVPDGAGGAMFAFRRNRPNLFGSRVDKNAHVPAAFPDTGLSLCTVSNDQFIESLVSDGMDGAYLLWNDRRDGQDDIYATRFTRDGVVGSTTGVEPPPVVPAVPRISMSAPSPNPTSNVASFELTMPATAHVRVEVRDLFGRLIAVLYDAEMAAGTHLQAWDGRDRDGRRAPPGIYLAQARTTASQSAGRRIVLLPE